MIWDFYHQELQELEDIGKIKRPYIPENIFHNGHIYYLLLATSDARDDFIESMRSREVQCVFHYIPLHSSKIGKKSWSSISTNGCYR